jgi:DNA modification methylase
MLEIPMNEMKPENQRVKLDKIKSHHRNYNRHPEHQVARIALSLKKFGQVRSIVVWKNTILAGHGVVEAARSLGWRDIAADVLPEDYPEHLALAYVAADNELSRLSDPDQAALAAILEESKAADDELLQAIGYNDQELQELLNEVGKNNKREEKDAAPQINRADELRQKWNVEYGQLWQLGEHRLICGDCTDAAVVARVMAGEKAEMVWTDPPYGVAVGDKNKFLNSIARSNRVEENLQNDTLDEPGLTRMLSASFDNAMVHCRAGAAWYVAAAPGPLHILFGQCLKDRGIWRQTIQWVKNNATFSPMGVCYHWQAEPLFFGWIPNGGHRWYGGRKQTTVWQIDRPAKSPEHPTMKPVELVARAIENSSLSDEIVYEPFSGSGTTIMACEQLGRRCRAVEIAPGYVAVALERWATATGKTPELIFSVDNLSR